MTASNIKKANSDADRSVQDRLLEAAEELFSEHGFNNTSIRDIATVADCNIAAVNYYFGGKDKLYLEVWRRHLLIMRNTHIASIDKVMAQNGGKPRLEELLRSFANAFIEPLADKSRNRRFIRLMAREMIDPHLSENVFSTELMKPTMAALQEALIKACPELDRSRIVPITLSIIGQLMHAVHIKTWLEHVDQEGLDLLNLDLSEVVEHIVKFSAAGIQAYAERKME